MAGYLIASGSAFAIDGEFLISNARIAQGGVTPGDAPGFPLTIAVPGHFKFVEDILVPAGTNGIEIRSGTVVVDLDGFRLSGAAQGGGALIGIYAAGFVGPTIQDGTIEAFDQYAIFLDASFGRIDAMLIVRNAGGIASVRAGLRATHSTIAENERSGIICSTSCHVEGNIVSSNGAHGIYLATGTVLGNTILDNSLWGIYATTAAGFANNTLMGNNSGNSQTSGPLTPLP